MKKQPNRWLIFSGLVFQIAIIMFLFIELGQWLDGKHNEDQNTFTLLSVCLAMCFILYLIIKQTKNIK
ncbi:MAG: hypothetical protein CNC91_01910 [Flavobacteriales bacterium MED-G22]|nr:MAG: hypothetical protein CNC91_01910 [Flavobacteriales bacterium MED-G22]